MNKTLIVTGATGFVGSHLIPVLRKKGYRLLLLTRKRKFETDDPLIIQCDISEESDVAEHLFSTYSPVGIIHLATCFVPSHTPAQIPEIIESNVTFGTKVLDLAVKYEVPYFINTGTFWQHFNGSEYDPVNLYAASKQAFETVAEYYKTISGIRFVTLCICDTYGPGDTRRKIFPLWKQLLEDPEAGMAMSPGEQLIDILHINDVVSGICHLLRMLENNSPETAGKNRFYLTSGDLHSLRQIAGIFQEVAGQKLNISWGERAYRTREVMHPRCCGTPLPGWTARISLRDGIREFLNR